MTAVVLAAGRGARLQASDPSSLATDHQRVMAARGLKILMPIGRGRRRLVDVILDRLRRAGCDRIVFVVPPDYRGLAGHLADRFPPGLHVRFAVQPAPSGTAGAVAAAVPLVHDDACLVVNGDTVYSPAALRAVARADGCAVAAFTRAGLERDSGFSPERIAAFAAVECDEAGWLTGIREKPPVDTLTAETRVSVNLWRMDQAMRAACADVAPSPRGEHELPDAVMLAVARGTRVRVVDVRGPVLDLTIAADVAALSRALIRPRRSA